MPSTAYTSTADLKRQDVSTASTNLYHTKLSFFYPDTLAPLLIGEPGQRRLLQELLKGFLALMPSEEVLRDEPLWARREMDQRALEAVDR